MQPSISPRSARLLNPKILAWAFYDWANSAYSTLSITILVHYLTNDVLADPWGKLVWGWGLGLTMFAAALCSPVVGAMADARANKRAWLTATTMAGAGASMLMFFATPDRPFLFVFLFLVSSLGMELSQGFYNAFLPEIADDATAGRVSAWGYGLGYLGGGLALLVALGIFTFGDRLGLPSENAFRLRAALLLMGAWWGLFSLPMLILVPDRGPPTADKRSFLETARHAFGEVAQTLRNIRRYRSLAWFLLGFLLFNDGVQTVISQASIFAQDVLTMNASELAQVILMIQFLALPGAIAIGYLAEAIGQKRALLFCLAIWIGLLIAAFFVAERAHFWLLAVFVALVLGGTQSVSRAIMSMMTPARHSAEFFGFFNFSGRATSVFGPSLFATVNVTTGNPHLALASLLVFFILGAAVVLPLKIERVNNDPQ